jgi:hypothetical protein
VQVVGDTEAPTAILTAPASIQAGADLTVSGANSIDVGGQIIRYRWQLDAFAVVETTTSSFTFAAATYPLAPGTHRVTLVVVDDSGNVSLDDSRQVQVVGDVSPPDTSIISGPSGTIASTSATFTFTSTESGSTFECQFDGGTFGTCPVGYSGLAQGSHVFAVRAVDEAGNVDATPATRSFTVDTVGPDTSITSGPSGPTNQLSPTFNFSSSEPGTFECRLDGPGATTRPFQACTSPRRVGPLVHGAYAFFVRAIDAAGNVDATPASRTFTIDIMPPNTTISSGPSAVSSQTMPTLVFGASEPSTFECRLDGPGLVHGTVQPCSSPRRYGPLDDGDNTFWVRATDMAGNSELLPAPRLFVVDTVPPDTTITSGPSGTITSSMPSFSFASGPFTRFECRLDGTGATGVFQPCDSPRKLGPLTNGSFVFAVRAIDAAGNIDPTPATRTFTVRLK